MTTAQEMPRAALEVEWTWAQRMLERLREEGTAIVLASSQTDEELQAAVVSGRTFTDNHGRYVVLRAQRSASAPAESHRIRSEVLGIAIEDSKPLGDGLHAVSVAIGRSQPPPPIPAWQAYEIDTDDVGTLEGFDGVTVMTGELAAATGLKMTRETARTLAERIFALLRVLPKKAEEPR